MSEDREPCSVCLDLNRSANHESTRWKYGTTSNMVSEHSLEFKLSALENSANSGCAKCSIVLKGLRLVCRNSVPAVDEMDDYWGRFILQADCAIEVEIFNRRVCERFQYYTEIAGKSGTPSASFGTARNVPAEISVDRCSSIVCDWITNCRDYHEGCCSANERGVASLPTRMLDVGHQDGMVIVLVNCADNEPCRTQQYATLSHCWGKVQVIQTTKQNLAERKRSINWELLPKTFQDAITIVRALNIRFIWIDSLCIIQDDELDWKTESVRMADIYSNGYINIAATGSLDSHGGCLSRRRFRHTSPMVDTVSFAIETPANYKQPTVFVRPSFDRIHNRYTTRSNWNLELPDARTVPLLSRAWVFQERYLAPRTLHFHPSEMVMECRSGFYCECTGLDKIALRTQRNSLKLRIQKGHEAFRSWFEVVDEYSRMRLTRESDRLPALTGVATAFQQRLQSGYLAGIWLKDIARGLLWDVTRNGSPDQRCIYRHPEASVPSWSWASLILGTGDVGIIFPAGDDDNFKVESHFAFLRTNMSMETTDPNSTPRDGTLWLRGLVVPTIGCFTGTSRDSEKGLILLFDQDANDMVLVSTVTMNMDVTRSKDDTSLKDFDEVVYCLIIGDTVDNGGSTDMEESSYDSDALGEDKLSADGVKYVCMLVLRQSPRDTDGFERIGIVDVRSQWGLFDDASEMTLKVM